MRSSLVLPLLAIQGLAACTDNGTGSAPFSSGVDPAKPVSALDQGELDRLCGALRGWLDAQGARSARLGCQLSAVSAARVGAKTDAEARANCKRLESECEMRRTSREPARSMTTCNRPPATCSVTVGQYETCLNDTAAELDKALAQVPTCDGLTLAPPAQPVPRASTQTPASCAQITAACGQPGASMQAPVPVMSMPGPTPAP
jgi:hypothetical protein